MMATADFLVSESIQTLDKKAEDLVQAAQPDFSKALLEKEKDKGLQLFTIVNQSMKCVRRVKADKVVKPGLKSINKSSCRKLKLQISSTRAFFKVPQSSKGRDMTCSIHPYNTFMRYYIAVSNKTFKSFKSLLVTIDCIDCVCRRGMTINTQLQGVLTKQPIGNGAIREILASIDTPCPSKSGMQTKHQERQ